jgi:drug/metabolite transporter (DMT)-like permease
MTLASPAAAASRASAAARLAFPLLLLGGTAVAASPIFVRLADVGPTASAFWRVLLALPVLALWARAEAPPGARLVPRLGVGEWRLILLAGLFFAGDLAFWHLSIVLTSVANATLFVADFTPVFVTLGVFLLFGERVSRMFVAAIVVGLAGAAILLSESLTLSREHVLGDVFGMITGLFWAAYFLAVSRVRPRVGAGALMLWTGIVTAALLLPLACLADAPLVPRSVEGWAVLAGLALVSHAGGQGLIALALAHLPASLSSLTMLIEPVMAAVFAWLLLGESLSARQIVGGAVVLGGIALARRAG